jgi:hypothetical protein
MPLRSGSGSDVLAMSPTAPLADHFLQRVGCAVATPDLVGLAKKAAGPLHP